MLTPHTRNHRPPCATGPFWQACELPFCDSCFPDTEPQPTLTSTGNLEAVRELRQRLNIASSQEQKHSHKATA